MKGTTTICGKSAHIEQGHNGKKCRACVKKDPKSKCRWALSA